jgi:O-phosphoseryl-tRNA(Sec) kinase
VARKSRTLLVILCGIPCSGKTQLALALAKDLEANYGLDAVVVDPDKIREMIPGATARFDPRREKLVESLALTMINESLRRKNTVISDDLNYYESTRHRLVLMAKRCKVKYAIIYLTVSVETAQERNRARTTPLPQELISKIGEEFDTPGTKYNWDKPNLVLDSEKVSPSEAERQALQIVLEAIKGKTENSKTKERNLRQRHDREKVGPIPSSRSLDLATRRALNELLSSGELQPSQSRAANSIRRAYVHEVSSKHLSIEEAIKELRNRIKERL